MFTGIIEATGTVKAIIPNGSNLSFWIESPLSDTLKTDQSVSHSGVCLTVEEVKENQHRVTAVAETLGKTTLGEWVSGTRVNLERSLRPHSLLDGHIVQGHVDTTGTCTSRKEKKGSWEFGFSFPKKFGELVIEKGSIAVNGISLTAFDLGKNSFRVAIIPYTFEHTDICLLEPGQPVNLEFDIIGKYLLRKLSLSASPRKKGKR